jgi:hypothetical protein
MNRHGEFGIRIRRRRGTYAGIECRVGSRGKSEVLDNVSPVEGFLASIPSRSLSSLETFDGSNGEAPPVT